MAGSETLPELATGKYDSRMTVNSVAGIYLVTPWWDCSMLKMMVGYDRTEISPAPPAAIMNRALLYRERTFQAEGGRVQDWTSDCFLWSEDGKYVRFPTGLLNRVRGALTEAGLQLRVRDHRKFDKRLKGSRKVLQAATLDDETVLQAVRANPMGQIEVKGLSQTAERISLIRQYYPRARMLVPVSSRNLADKMYGALRQEGVTVSRQVTGQQLEVGRCAIVTFKRLNAVLPGDWDLVLLTDPQGATRDTSAGPLAHAILESAVGRYNDDGERVDRGVRIYSFIGRDWKPDRKQELRLEAISGPVIVENRPLWAGVQCRWLKTPSCPVIEAEDALDFKQQAYWSNERRNQFVAGVAQAFQSCNSRKLKKYGIRFHGDEPQIRGGQEPNVAVMVESMEHAMELHELLPGWYVWHRSGDEPEPENNPLPKNGIITVTAAQHHGLQADVLIVASGDPALMQIPDFLPTVFSIDDKDVRLIDFDDEFDRKAQRMSLGRKRNCLRQGWTVEEQNSQA